VFDALVTKYKTHISANRPTTNHNFLFTTLLHAALRWHLVNDRSAEILSSQERRSLIGEGRTHPGEDV